MKKPKREELPRLVFADIRGRILDHPHLAAVGRSGRVVVDLDPDWLIPLPRNSQLYFLPGRAAVGRDPVSGEIREVRNSSALAAFLPPAYTLFLLAGFVRRASVVPLLPLYAYAAVCWYRGRFHVPAVRMDADIKHDPPQFSRPRIARQVQQWLMRFPHNRLVKHLGVNCALRYNCPNAQNLFLERWEAPVAVAATCNAACLGCISQQPEGTVPASQERLSFVPRVDEIVDIAVPHLENAPQAMISFGQGCEGEPLLRTELVAKAIREIRRHTSRGTIQVNTNGSRPYAVRRLIDAGLDSVRVSLNSARPEVYGSYYQPRGYCFTDVVQSIHAAAIAGLWTSINYLCFPGVTDQPAEFAALCELVQSSGLDMIQWRNLNIDPDWYLDCISLHGDAEPMGIPALLAKLRECFPHLRFGYFNPPREEWLKSAPATV